MTGFFSNRSLHSTVGGRRLDSRMNPGLANQPRSCHENVVLYHDSKRAFQCGGEGWDGGREAEPHPGGDEAGGDLFHGPRRAARRGGGDGGVGCVEDSGAVRAVVPDVRGEGGDPHRDDAG
jgi:hypothetical protein